MESDWSISCKRMWYVRYACEYLNLRCCIATSRRRFCRSTLHVFAASSTATNLHNKRGLWVTVFKFYANLTVIFTSFWGHFLGWQIWQHCYGGKESLDICRRLTFSQVMQQTCYWVLKFYKVWKPTLKRSKVWHKVFWNIRFRCWYSQTNVLHIHRD